MGKTLVVIIIVLLSLACGALGWEVLRRINDNESLQKDLGELRDDITVLSASLKAKQSGNWATEEAMDELRTYLQTLDAQMKDVLAKQKEFDKKLAGLGKAGPSAPGGSFAGVDLDSIPEEQREALAEMAKNAAREIDTERIGMFKNMAKNRLNSMVEENVEKLGLTPLQKSDIGDLIEAQVEKGFKRVGEAFEKGDWTAIRAQIRQIIEESDIKLKDILDPDQIDKLKELDPRGFGQREERRQENK